MMSLSAREQKDLDSIAVRLAAADPELASLLSMFGQLVVDEEMPLYERIRLFRPDAARGRHRKQSRRRLLPAATRRQRESWPRIAVLMCILASIGVVLGTLVSLSGHSECAHPGMASCATSAPAWGTAQRPREVREERPGPAQRPAAGQPSARRHSLR